MVSHSDSFSRNVGEIFDTRPRVAIDSHVRWMNRAEEKSFRSSVVYPGVHVCLYGPSGSGKTSLAKTILGRLCSRGLKLIYVKLNHNSDWNSFKSQILENKAAKAASEKRIGVKIGLKSIIPYLEFDGELGGGSFAKSASRSEIVSSISISDIGQFLIDSNFVLATDDANFADDELLHILTGLAKYVTDNSEGSSAKLVFIGADDIYSRIIQLEDSLKDRTDEVSLGSIRDIEELNSNASSKSVTKVHKDKVWDFIASGLGQLGLTDPRKDKFVTKQQQLECIEWINYAADGLPKSIVALGRKIAEKGEYRSRVSHSDILNSSKEMVAKNYRQYRSQYRTLISMLKKDILIQELCKWMFKKGASRIHRLEDLGEDLREIATYSMFDEAMKILSDVDFLTVTGPDGNIFFAKDPLLAHTIGVALYEPEKCGVDLRAFKNDSKAHTMLLQFSGDKDPENKESF